MDGELIKAIESIFGKEQPVVPAKLIRYTCGHSDLHEYNRSGSEVAALLALSLQKALHLDIGQAKRVLDFGCGAGRVLARLPFGKSAEVYGCDVGEDVAAYTMAQFPWARVHRNALMPPLAFEDGFFDLVYSFSVFSHLSQDVEDQWLGELARIGAPGCSYLLTVHGDWVIEKTLGEEALAACEAGFFWKKVHGPGDFPAYYEASYHTSAYITDRWSRFFDIVDVLDGRSSMNCAFDEASESLVKNIRPMGQDIVVARKR